MNDEKTDNDCRRLPHSSISRKTALPTRMLYQSNRPEFFMNEIVAFSMTLLSMVPKMDLQTRVNEKEIIIHIIHTGDI